MANTKSVQKTKNDSVKYTNMFAAYAAFWRRGFTEWGGTSSRSEYWWTVLMNILISLLYMIIVPIVVVLMFAPSMAYMDDELMLASSVLLASGYTLIALLPVMVFVFALIIPSISQFTRRMHDAGMSAWFWFFALFNLIPFIGGLMWFVFKLVVALLPTKTTGNPYHKNNK